MRSRKEIMEEIDTMIDSGDNPSTDYMLFILIELCLDIRDMLENKTASSYSTMFSKYLKDRYTCDTD